MKVGALKIFSQPIVVYGWAASASIQNCPSLIPSAFLALPLATVLAMFGIGRARLLPSRVPRTLSGFVSIGWSLSLTNTLLAFLQHILRIDVHRQLDAASAGAPSAAPRAAPGASTPELAIAAGSESG